MVEGVIADEMTALFQPGSQIAKRILKLRDCLLDFQQYAQRFTMFCRARAVPQKDAAHQATLWHNRIFPTSLFTLSLDLLPVVHPTSSRG